MAVWIKQDICKQTIDFHMKVSLKLLIKVNFHFFHYYDIMLVLRDILKTFMSGVNQKLYKLIELSDFI